MNITDIAKVVHNIQMVYCASIGEPLPKWEEAPKVMRSTTTQGVADLIYDLDAGPGYSHAKWMAHKIADGYVYGKIKDHVKKTHPSILPFEQLTLTDQTKDHLFVETVRSLQPFLDGNLDERID